MRPDSLRAACAVVALLCGLWSAQAQASGLLLGFGERYSTAEGSAIHRGVDVACAEDDAAESLIAGTVTFAGRLPGSDSASAVTVSSGDERVTLSPLNALTVSRGAAVVAGDRLGDVAAAGDPSSPQTHLHVSLRRGDVYLDPSDLIRQAPPGEIDAPEVQPAPAPAQGAGVPGVGGAPVALAPVTGMLADGVSLAPATGAPAGARGSVPVSAGEGGVSRQVSDGRMSAGSMSEPGVGGISSEGAREIADGVSLTPRDACAEDAAHSLARSRPGERILQGGLQVVRAVAGSPLAIFLLVVACSAAGLLMSRRALESRLVSTTPVSDRFETLLQHARAGAKLCGLTSCSGLLPSQSRSRLAQRR